MNAYAPKMNIAKQTSESTAANHINDRRSESQALQRKNSVLQKMAVMAVDNYGDQADSLVWDNLHFAVSEVGAPVGDLQDHLVWNQAKKGEKIRIIEHGEPQKVGGKTASDIANTMLDDVNGIPAGNVSSIEFQSCYAGSGVSSLVSEMAKKLSEKGHKGIPVSGRTGIAFGFKGMGAKTARDDEYQQTGYEYGEVAYHSAKMTYKDAKTKWTNVDVFGDKNALTYNPPWILIGKTKDEWDSMKQRNKRRLVSSNLSDYWTAINGFMVSCNAFKSLDQEKQEVISA